MVGVDVLVGVFVWVAVPVEVEVTVGVEVVVDVEVLVGVVVGVRVGASSLLRSSLTLEVGWADRHPAVRATHSSITMTIK